MRLGLVLSEGREAEMARLAEAHGLFGVLAGSANPLTAVSSAVYASTATDLVRVIARVQLGLEHPVTMAEELGVLDNVNNGRTVILADTGQLDAADAAEEVEVLRAALSNRPLQHDASGRCRPACRQTQPPPSRSPSHPSRRSSRSRSG